MGYRHLARGYADFALRTITGKRDPLIPPPWLHSIGDGDFRKVGEHFLAHFIDLGGMKPADRVLDVGSGTGRMAIPLIDYLTSGTYDGLEIVKSSVDWCKKAYEPYPAFSFRHADVRSEHYNPGGSFAASEYRFPFADASFDFVFLTSVFTHMLPAAVENYLGEMRRVMAPEGRALFTVYLLDGNAPNPHYSFDHYHDGCWSAFQKDPERVIAYSADLQLFIRDAGLEIQSVHPGSWRGIDDGASFQDIIVAKSR
jgi:SAM-dependent methyltransferase